jgi:putative copper resistance protein D
MDNYLYLPRAAAAALYDLSFAAATGLLLCLLWLPGHALGKRLARWLLACSIVLFCTLPAQFWLITATMLGSAAPHDVLPQLRDVLTTTHSGRMATAAILPALILLALATIAATHNPQPKTQNSTQTRPRRLALQLSLAAVLALAILRSATGHAAAKGDFTLDEAVQLLHLAATAVWAGLILAAGSLVSPALLRAQDHATLTRTGRRISRAATVAIAGVIFSGIYNAWRGLEGKLPPLVHTQWGWLLTAKSTLVATALLLGLYNRLLLARNPELLPQDARRFTGSLRLEAALMLAILVLSAFLANSPPATMTM